MRWSRGHAIRVGVGGVCPTALTGKRQNILVRTIFRFRIRIPPAGAKNRHQVLRSAYYCDRRARFDGLSGLNLQLFDGARCVCDDRVLHLHRFENTDRASGLDELSFFNEHLDDRSLHRSLKHLSGSTDEGTCTGRGLGLASTDHLVQPFTDPYSYALASDLDIEVS